MAHGIKMSFTPRYEDGIFYGTLDSDPCFFEGLAPDDVIAFRFVYEQLPEAVV